MVTTSFSAFGWMDRSVNRPYSSIGAYSSIGGVSECGIVAEGHMPKEGSKEGWVDVK